MVEPFFSQFTSLVPQYFETEWKAEDGLSREELEADLAESGVQIPASLEALYRAIGAVEDLMEAYYFIWDADELEIEDGFLLFMEDEDERYTWGIPVGSLDVPDPLVCRRTNARGTWTDMEGTLSEYMLDYFAWVFLDVAPALGDDDEDEDTDAQDRAE